MTMGMSLDAPSTLYRARNAPAAKPKKMGSKKVNSDGSGNVKRLTRQDIKEILRHPGSRAKLLQMMVAATCAIPRDNLIPYEEKHGNDSETGSEVSLPETL